MQTIYHLLHNLNNTDQNYNNLFLNISVFVEIAAKSVETLLYILESQDAALFALYSGIRILFAQFRIWFRLAVLEILQGFFHTKLRGHNIGLARR